MAVVEAGTGRVVSMQPIGKGVDATDRKGSGRGRVRSGPRAHMALDRKTGKAYLSVAEFGPRPAAVPGKPQPKAPMIPGTFGVLVAGK